MFTKYVLPLLAVLGLGFAIFTVVQARQTEPPAKPLMPPPERPKAFKSIAGAGIVEAQKRNIPIGTQVPGVVTEVSVREGMKVKAGEPLFEIDARQLLAEKKVREAQLLAARAELEKLKAAPRPEDLPPAIAAVEEARARVASTEIQARRSASLYERGVGTPSDYDRDRFAAAEARAGLQKSEKELERLQRGTWDRDLAIARASVASAEADVERVQTELDRLTVKALTDGQVLQVNVLPGQYAAMAWKEPLIVLGDVEKLHVRVDIDEQDLPYFRPGARAVATLKGRPGVTFNLDFVRVDPYVIPKRNLTGDNAERVDTRVLQVIYALPDERPIDVYVGQQMDVYLEAAQDRQDLNLEFNSEPPDVFDGSPGRGSDTRESSPKPESVRPAQAAGSGA
jgi:multidrug resistance efflux pump